MALRLGLEEVDDEEDDAVDFKKGALKLVEVLRFGTGWSVSLSSRLDSGGASASRFELKSWRVGANVSTSGSSDDRREDGTGRMLKFRLSGKS